MNGKPLRTRTAKLIRLLAECEQNCLSNYGGAIDRKKTTLPLEKVTPLVG